MQMRKPMVAGNWKMNKTVSEARDFAAKVGGASRQNAVEAVLCAPFTALAGLRDALEEFSPGVKVGAQNMYWKDEGAFTGEISPLMLRELGISYVILGHSERRAYFHETDEEIGKKALSAFHHALIPILCVGETLEERERNETERIISRQLEIFRDFPEENVEQMVVAYEPVWAIGTGKTATSEEAARVIAWIRRKISSLVSQKASEGIRILYGGSVSPGNIGELMAEEEIDGALVGGASLKPDNFLEMIEIAGRRRGK